MRALLLNKLVWSESKTEKKYQHLLLGNKVVRETLSTLLKTWVGSDCAESILALLQYQRAQQELVAQIFSFQTFLPPLLVRDLPRLACA